jgi:oxygen-independent coproporphyrinogen III oxidase
MVPLSCITFGPIRRWRLTMGQNPNAMEVREAATAFRRSLPEQALRKHGLWRDRNKYFLNIAYPSMQAMHRLDPKVVQSRYGTHLGSRPISLYVHVPFCSGLCSYCHYYKIIGKTNLVDSYLTAIASELSHYKALSGGLCAETIYVGGGTPSFLTTPQIERIFATIRRSVDVSRDAEISFEVHPEHACPELFACLRRVGVNRINIGVESFDDSILVSENRRHTAQQAIDAIKLAQEHGFENTNIDLIYGLPHQTVDGWLNSIGTATALVPASVCAYYLRIKETTPMFKWYQSKQQEFPSEDDVLLMHISTIEHAARSGFNQYIVDWFFRDERFFHKYQMHNWQTTDTTSLLGVGPSAYSYVDGVQYYNVNDLGEYVLRINESKSPIEKGEVLTSEVERVRRALMLGLKCSISRSYFRDVYGFDVVECFDEEMRLLAHLELIEIDSEVVRLTKAGTLFADEIGQLFYSASIRERMDAVKKTIVSTTVRKKNPFSSIVDTSIS